MGIGTSSSSEGHAPLTRIAYAVHRDARLSWGGLPAPGRGLSSVRPDACHLIWMAAGSSSGGPASVQIGTICVARLGPVAGPLGRRRGGGVGPVVDDTFHDDGGGEFLHAGQGGEFVVPQGLVGLEAGGGDAEEVVGVAE